MGTDKAREDAGIESRHPRERHGMMQMPVLDNKASRADAGFEEIDAFVAEVAYNSVAKVQHYMTKQAVIQSCTEVSELAQEDMLKDTVSVLVHAVWLVALDTLCVVYHGSRRNEQEKVVEEAVLHEDLTDNNILLEVGSAALYHSLEGERNQAPPDRLAKRHHRVVLRN
jgi:hypothetical protein